MRTYAGHGEIGRYIHIHPCQYAYAMHTSRYRRIHMQAWVQDTETGVKILTQMCRDKSAHIPRDIGTSMHT